MSFKRSRSLDNMNPSIKKSRLEQSDEQWRIWLWQPEKYKETEKFRIDDPLDYFSKQLTQDTLEPFPSSTSHLSAKDYRDLYKEHAGDSYGAHFVIHQHDHPIAGTHYVLRLQINETSCMSWAIKYGLPGDPNSIRPTRIATETRVHCLWNNLLETATDKIGSLLIWDTGYCTVEKTRSHADSESSGLSPIILTRPSKSPEQMISPGGSTYYEHNNPPELPEDEKPPKIKMDWPEKELLYRAFQAGNIRLALHGTRLPMDYVLNLRLTREEDDEEQERDTHIPETSGAPAGPSAKGKEVAEPSTSSGSESDDEIVHAPVDQDVGKDSSMALEVREVEDSSVRETNAFPGSTDSIGGVFQRRWYLSLDPEACGLIDLERDGRWQEWGYDSETEDLQEGDGKGKQKVSRRTGRFRFPFYVRGVEHERSVVTGRLASDILTDNGVDNYVGKKGWQAILE